MSETIVDLPSVYQNHDDLIVVDHEEEAVCWLWAYPELLPWNHPVTWLYTPVVGKHRWPGDLWGLDTKGNLLVIEAKRCGRRNNPFEDFVPYHRDGREELSAAHWMSKWKGHMHSELRLTDSTAEPTEGHTDGILPRSNRRQHLRRWMSLAKQIDSAIRTTGYCRKVDKALRTRATSSDPTPFYIALMIESRRNGHVLNDSLERSARELRQKVTRDHVMVVAISCRRLPGDQARISTRLVDLA